MFLQNVQTSAGAHSASIQWVQGVLSWVWSRQGMKLTTHLHLMLRLQMSGAELLTPLYAFNAWAGNTTPLPLLKRWYMKMLQGGKKEKKKKGEKKKKKRKKKLTKLLQHPCQNVEWPIWRETVCCVSGSTCSYKKLSCWNFPYSHP